MGHIAVKQVYSRLRDRLDAYPVGAPGRATIFEILKILYTPEEAELASKLPLRFQSLGAISRKLGIPKDQLQTKLEKLADKGLVLDMYLGGKMRYMLPPTVVGIFEFSMMRVRDDIDQPYLAKMLRRYLVDEPEFSHQFHPDTKTSPFRTLIHEDSLPADYTQVLDYERATHVVETANKWAVGICHCRHVAHHHGKECEKMKMESCMTLGNGADYTARHGFARAIEKSEALDFLAETQKAGLVHLGDNVQRNLTFICNCCSCCCEVLAAFRKFKIFGTTFSSNFEARVDPDACNGCKLCAKACPVDAIDVLDAPRTMNGKKLKWIAKVDPSVCLGCGVCAPACKFDSMKMSPRAQRHITPETTMSRVMTMAIEQGKLHELLVDIQDGPAAQVTHTLLGAILKLPPTRQLLARDSLRSRFVDFLVSGAKKAGVRDV